MFKERISRNFSKTSWFSTLSPVTVNCDWMWTSPIYLCRRTPKVRRMCFRSGKGSWKKCLLFRMWKTRSQSNKLALVWLQSLESSSLKIVASTVYIYINGTYCVLKGKLTKNLSNSFGLSLDVSLNNLKKVPRVLQELILGWLPFTCLNMAHVFW